MLIYLSVVDKHKPEGQRHIASILIDVPQIQVEATHYEIVAMNAAIDVEEFARPFVGALMNRAAVEAMDAAIGSQSAAVARSRLHKPTYSAKVKAEPIIARDLKPGELFSTYGPDYWDRFASRPSVGESAYIRTCTPTDEFPDGDAEVFRITIVREVVR